MNIDKKEHRNSSRAEPEEPPPFFRTWNRVYIAVVVYTGALVLALHFITVSLNRR